MCVTNALQAWRCPDKRRRTASSLRKLYPHPPTRFFVLLPPQVSLVFHQALGVRLLLTPMTKLSWTSTMSRCALTSKTTSHPEARKQRKMPSASSYCSCLPLVSQRHRTGCDGGRKKKLVGTVSCLLFPLTCAWALTCHRFQGQTVDHLCLHAYQSSPHRALIVNKQYYYVALSRVRTLLGLSMTELLEEDPEYYTPDTSLLVHDAVQTLHDSAAVC